MLLQERPYRPQGRESESVIAKWDDGCLVSLTKVVP
jgi:hypothetical protein